VVAVVAAVLLVCASTLVEARRARQRDYLAGLPAGDGYTYARLVESADKSKAADDAGDTLYNQACRTCIEYVDMRHSSDEHGETRAKALCDARRRASAEDGERCDTIGDAYDVHHDVTAEDHPMFEGDMPAGRKSILSYTLSSIKNTEDSMRSDPYDDSVYDDDNFIELASSVRHRVVHRRASAQERLRAKRSADLVDDADHATKSQSLITCESMQFCDIESAPPV